MKGLAQIMLLSLWLFVIVLPSVITLLDTDGQTFMFGNLNEEEQQAQEENIGDENTLLNFVVFDFVLINRLGNRNANSLYLEHSLDTALEIVLPPPELS